jgi:hypothetical protein
MRHRLYSLKLWLRERPDKIAWWLVWKMPRRIALVAFVRVCSATKLAPDQITYEVAYKSWERGEGA